MTLERSPGAVGCGHCRQLDTTSSSCAICGRPVCSSCAATPADCPRPTARSQRLGMGWQLRAVDDNAKRGVATNWTGRCFLVELATKERIALPRDALVRLGPGNQLTYAWSHRVVVVDTNLHPDIVHGVHIHIDSISTLRDLVVSEDGAHAALSGVTEDGGFVVYVLRLGERQERDIRFIKAQSCVIAANAATDLLAVGSQRQVRFYQLSRATPPGDVPIGVLSLDAKLGWLALCVQHLAAITTNGALHLYDRSPSGAWIKHRAFDVRTVSEPIRAAIAPDGRLIAVCEGYSALTVIRPADGKRQKLSGHTGRIILVAFVNDGRALITADSRNRVIHWPCSEHDGKDGRIICDKIVPA